MSQYWTCSDLLIQAREGFVCIWSITLVNAIGQLPRVSGKDPERKEWTSVFETFFVCLFFWANFLIFIQYSTEEYSTVQVFIWCLDTIA